MSRGLPAVALALALVASACTEAASTESVAVPTTQPVATSPSTTPNPSTTEPSTSKPTTAESSTTTEPPCVDPTNGFDGREAAPPAELVAALTDELDSSAWSQLDVSISVWVDGFGEAFAVNPDERLVPASNQKMLTALGAFEFLDLDDRFVTEVVAEGKDLVLRAGGDPTLRLAGAHSLDALAQQIAEAGMTQVEQLRVDASYFEPATMAEGWLDWQMPRYVGPMSALMVDDNRYRIDDAYLTDPAIGNAEAFVAALGRAGVSVESTPVQGVASGGEVVARLESTPFRDLVEQMLRASDNEIAEAMLRELGGGRTSEGVATIAGRFEAWCFATDGSSTDGSGLSRSDLRSAREWRHVLQLISEQAWGNDFAAMLPISGETGTLANRLGSADVRGRVRAKTGWLIGGRALSGYLTTAGGREAVFSIIVNGEAGPVADSVGAIDRLVRIVAADSS